MIEQDLLYNSARPQRKLQTCYVSTTPISICMNIRFLSFMHGKRGLERIDPVSMIILLMHGAGAALHNAIAP